MRGKDTRLGDDFLANVFLLCIVDVVAGGADSACMMDDLDAWGAGSTNFSLCLICLFFPLAGDLHVLQPLLHLRVVLSFDLCFVEEVFGCEQNFGVLLGHHEAVLRKCEFMLSAANVLDDYVHCNLWGIGIVAENLI